MVTAMSNPLWTVQMVDLGKIGCYLAGISSVCHTETGKVSTPIEKFLFAGRGVHAVVEFSQKTDSIRLGLAPWESLESLSVADFFQARVTSIDVYADDVDALNMPWDIIGFDCHELSDGRWQFVVHCEGIEFGFDSEWPTLTKG